MTDIIVNRRHILITGISGVALALPGCSGLPTLSLTEVIRRLLTRSSQSAFAQLLTPGGFYDNEISRIALPDKLGGSTGSGVLGLVLNSGAFRTSLQKELNKAAEKGAERAAPIVADTIRSVSIADAAALVRGGPQAATGFLRGEMGTTLLSAMMPGVGDALKLANNDIVSQAIKSVSGFDVTALAQDVTTKANGAIWSAIGKEEAAIRANPQATNDPLLIAAFGLAQ